MQTKIFGAIVYGQICLGQMSLNQITKVCHGLHGLVDNFRCASVCGCHKTSFVVKSIVTTFENLELILFLDDKFNNHMHFSFYPNSALICNSADF